jgi:hypothetical protein
MKLKLFLQWLRLNFKFLMATFCVTGVLIWLFPQAMLAIYAKWATVMQAAGAKNITELSTQSEMFKHILQMNSLTVILVLIIGLFLQSPIVMVLMGVFYALVSLLAPYAIGRSFGMNDWFLIVVEAFVLLLSISLSSAIAGELFGVEASRKSIWDYWKQDWKRLLPKPVENWKTILAGWAPPLVIGIFILGGLSIFVAWFETYGY